jgi:hypothetical protein
MTVDFPDTSDGSDLIDGMVGQSEQASTCDEYSRVTSQRETIACYRTTDEIYAQASYRTNGGELLDCVVRILSRYLTLPKEAIDTVVLWTVFTHAHEVAVISPILALLSPEPRCGKTTALELISRLVPRPMPTSNISPAALYRSIEIEKPTLIMDEADTFFPNGRSMVGMVNSGHVRTAAVVVRAAANAGIIKSSTWCPKVIASIGSLPVTTSDRSIIIPLKRKRHDEKVERLREEAESEFSALRESAATWAKSHLETLRIADPGIPEALNDRAADNWRLLIAIADLAGGDWPERARIAAVKLSASTAGAKETDPAVLLSDIRQIFKDAASDRLKSAGIASSLGQMEERPWPEWRHGRPITPVQIAVLLDRYSIKPSTHRFGQETAKGYLLAQFEDAFARYLKPEE